MLNPSHGFHQGSAIPLVPSHMAIMQYIYKKMSYGVFLKCQFLQMSLIDNCPITVIHPPTPLPPPLSTSHSIELIWWRNP